MSNSQGAVEDRKEMFHKILQVAGSEILMKLRRLPSMQDKCFMICLTNLESDLFFLIDKYLHLFGEGQTLKRFC